MTLDQDEQLFVDALHRSAGPTPDLSAIAHRAARSGTRLRHRHQARATVATLAVVGLGAAGTAALAAGGHHDSHSVAPLARPSSSVAQDPADASVAPTPVAPTTPPTLDTSSAYAVLDAAGWSPTADNVIADDKLYYVQDGTDASVSLNWRPSAALGPKYTIEQEQADLDARYGGRTMLATTTMDGGAAHVFEDHGMLTVVGAIDQGRFLTLSGSGLTLDQIAELATHVHRQPAEHLADQPQ